jgi:hypothetical protein
MLVQSRTSFIKIRGPVAVVYIRGVPTYMTCEKDSIH